MMERWLVLVETNCKDEKRDSEFNAWYDEVHIPDVLSFTDHKSAARYTLRYPAVGKGKYLAVYEIETENIQKTMEASMKQMEAKKAAGRWSDLLEIASIKLCKVEERK